ncbi:hypothetical protein K469DRAFT_693908, partial [Zopfia rhizophila CBS 207.26]
RIGGRLHAEAEGQPGGGAPVRRGPPGTAPVRPRQAFQYSRHAERMMRRAATGGILQEPVHRRAILPCPAERVEHDLRLQRGGEAGDAPEGFEGIVQRQRDQRLAQGQGLQPQGGIVGQHRRAGRQGRDRVPGLDQRLQARVARQAGPGAVEARAGGMVAHQNGTLQPGLQHEQEAPVGDGLFRQPVQLRQAGHPRAGAQPGRQPPQVARAEGQKGVAGVVPVHLLPALHQPMLDADPERRARQAFPQVHAEPGEGQGVHRQHGGGGPEVLDLRRDLLQEAGRAGVVGVFRHGSGGMFQHPVRAFRPAGEAVARGIAGQGIEQAAAGMATRAQHRHGGGEVVERPEGAAQKEESQERPRCGGRCSTESRWGAGASRPRGHRQHGTPGGKAGPGGEEAPLGAVHGRQRGIQPGRKGRDVAGGILAPRQDLPLRHHQWQQQAVPVARLDGAETRPGQQAPGGGRGVAAGVVDPRVMGRTQPLEGRQVQDHPAARRQDAVELGQGQGLGHAPVAKHVHRHHGVEAAIGEGQAVDVAAGHGGAGLGGGPPGGGGVVFQPGAPQPGQRALQPPQEAARAAAGIQHAGAGRQGGQGMGQPGMDGAVPPHAFLGLVHQRVFGGLHGADYSPGPRLPQGGPASPAPHSSARNSPADVTAPASCSAGR